jgi:hypothetical protein
MKSAAVTELSAVDRSCVGKSTAEDPVRFFRPPYVRHKERVGVRSDRRPG